ncbi:MAG: hypothetical protein RLZZ262_450 [Bacteroidota bacterium]|jgi:uncharacterized membrane protein
MKFLKYLSYFMVIFFFMAGLFCIFSDTANEYLIGWRKYVMGAVFIAYGVLRGLRIQKQLNQIK